MGFKNLLEKGKKIPTPFPPLGVQQVQGGDAIPEGTARSATFPPRVKLRLPRPSSESLRVKLAPDHGLSDSSDNDDDDDIPQARSPRYRGSSVIVKEELAISLGKDEGDELGDVLPPAY